MTVHAPATAVIERINPAGGTVQPLDADTCVLTTGADTVQTLAAHLGMLDFDFDVTEPVELVDHLRRLADRYARSTLRRPLPRTTASEPGALRSRRPDGHLHGPSRRGVRGRGGP
ncbi:hypothetical protein [Streptomyces sp. NPDC002324]